MPSPAGPTSAERRPAIIAGVALASLLAWAYVVHVARAPEMAMDMDMPMDMPMPAGGSETFLPLLAMWVAMMAGMMLPSVLPTLLWYAAIARRRAGTGQPPLSVPAFTGGYLVTWIGFSAAAAALQVRLSSGLLAQAAVARPAAIAAGVLLLLTGLYQWTAFKAACLSHCRSPLAHFGAHWREGSGGAFRMGLEHGAVCLGCCWLLMGLLFVGGVMNPLWVGGLTLLVLVEKVMPRGDLVGKIAGVALAGWGLALLVSLPTGS